jgi:hypothetical protein
MDRQYSFDMDELFSLSDEFIPQNDNQYFLFHDDKMQDEMLLSLEVNNCIQ